MKPAIVAVFVCLLSVLAVPCFAETKIAVINSREVVAKCDMGVKAMAEMKELFAPRQQQLIAKQQEIIAMQNELKGKELEKNPKREEIDARIRGYSQEDAILRRDLAVEEEKRLKPITEKLTTVVKAYAEEKKLTAVQEKAQFYYIEPSLDITEEILKRMNLAK